VSLALQRSKSTPSDSKLNQTKSHNNKSSKQTHTHNKILHLQQKFDNQTIQRMIKSGSIQAKLKISQPNDPYEREADKVAEQIMRMSEKNENISNKDKSQDKVQRKLAGKIKPKREELKISRKSKSSSNLEASDEISNEISHTGSGKPLDNTTKQFMEPKFGHDFSSVKIHDDSKSNELARAVNARAFTKGNDVFLGKNESSSDKSLIAHELTHVMQQNGNNIQRKPLDSASPEESTEKQEDNKSQVATESEKQEEELLTTGEETEAEEELYSADMGDEFLPSKKSPTYNENISMSIEERAGLQQIKHKHPVKRKHIAKPIGKETVVGDNGHVDYSIKEKVKIFKKGKKYKGSIKKLDVITRVFVWPAATPGRWDKIEDFGPHYGKAYDAGFNLHPGTLRHEKQHVKEVLVAWKKYRAKFVTDVKGISETTKAKAKQKYRDLLKKFKKDVHTEYWKNGETDGRRVEWEYYHSEYTKYLASKVTKTVENLVESVMNFW